MMTSDPAARSRTVLCNQEQVLVWISRKSGSRIGDIAEANQGVGHIPARWSDDR
jgi:hypothetical protein